MAINIKSVNIENISAEQKNIIAAILGVNVEDIVPSTPVKKEINITDFFYTEEETRDFWNSFFDEIHSTAKYIIDNKQLMSSTTEDIDYIIDCASFFLDKKDFIECNTWAIWCPMFGDLPGLMYSVKSENKEMQQKIDLFNSILDKWYNNYEQIEVQAKRQNKMFGLFESCHME